MAIEIYSKTMLFVPPVDPEDVLRFKEITPNVWDDSGYWNDANIWRDM